MFQNELKRLKNLSWLHDKLITLDHQRDDFKDVTTAFEVRERIKARIAISLHCCIAEGVI